MSPLAALAEFDYGDAIRERRIELGWSQTELAERAGLGQGDVSRIENGRDAHISTIQKLSRTLYQTTDAPRRSRANGARRQPGSTNREVWTGPSGPVLPLDH